jgi:hypothetical protein
MNTNTQTRISLSYLHRKHHASPHFIHYHTKANMRSFTTKTAPACVQSNNPDTTTVHDDTRRHLYRLALFRQCPISYFLCTAHSHHRNSVRSLKYSHRYPGQVHHHPEKSDLVGEHIPPLSTSRALRFQLHCALAYSVSTVVCTVICRVSLIRGTYQYRNRFRGTFECTIPLFERGVPH